MAPPSYKVVGLLSLLYLMTAVVATPVDLLRVASSRRPIVGTSSTTVYIPSQVIGSIETVRAESDGLEESNNNSISNSDLDNEYG
jgi:hypothetical protein